MNEYAENLVNSQKKIKLIATEDIVSDNGVLLAQSGIELNRKTCENILRFKLLKPLEDSIAIENQLNAKSIYDKTNQMVLINPNLIAMHKEINEKKSLQKCCLRLEKYPLIQQKLTVLCVELPHVFDQSILSAYLAYLCAHLEKQSQSKIEEYFLAGLVHDIGFLHLNHKIFKKKGELTPEEWRSIQSHPIIGYEILKSVDNFPQTVSRAVLEHHENLDGTGYPRKKTANDLCELGQFISLLDNVICIYNKKFKDQGRSLRCVIPVLQINMHSYFPAVASSIIRMLKKSPDTPIQSIQPNLVNDIMDNSQKKQEYIQQTTQLIKAANKEIGFTHNNKEVYYIQNIANNIIFIVNSAGLYVPYFMGELDNLNEEDKHTHFNELADTLVMLEEIIYQCQFYQKTSDIFVSNNPQHQIAHIISESIKKIRALPSPDKTGSFRRTKNG
jgi:HD-GYP domain-containing protein (c-di-GMP phosphodiesterase class II)